MPCAQIYDQIYLDSLAAKAGFPFVATNYTSPILHSVELPRLKPSTTYGLTLQPFCLSTVVAQTERFSVHALPSALQRLYVSWPALLGFGERTICCCHTLIQPTATHV